MRRSTGIRDEANGNSQQTEPHEHGTHELCAIVHENWKLLTNRDATHSELYDITADPYEKADLSKEKPEVVTQLMQQIDDWKATLPESPFGDVFSSERSQTAAD